MLILNTRTVTQSYCYHQFFKYKSLYFSWFNTFHILVIFLTLLAFLWVWIIFLPEYEKCQHKQKNTNAQKYLTFEEIKPKSNIDQRLCIKMSVANLYRNVQF